jgi:hypothetical protein
MAHSYKIMFETSTKTTRNRFLQKVHNWIECRDETHFPAMKSAAAEVCFGGAMIATASADMTSWD